VRSFGVGVDKKGKKRLLLNGKPYFFNGVLDQGYWSDGLLTYPSDEAVLDELTMLKNMGFNTVRKHIKLEPFRWYYYCDKIGLTVWQDFVNGGGVYDFMHIALMPFLGFKHKDSDYKYFAREEKKGRDEFMQMTDEILHYLKNFTCISLWTIFNEGWGQFDSYHISQYVSQKDDTRLIDSVSGWHDQGKKKTTLKVCTRTIRHSAYRGIVVPSCFPSLADTQ
jgi:beta-galactosidase/beta-glucuronidase